MNKILIVDDDYAIRLFFQEELTCEGYEVIPTSTSEDLQEIIEQHRPDLIVLDIRMKNANEPNILEDIMNIDCNLPIVLCTSHPAFKYDQKFAAVAYSVVRSSDLSELKLKIKMAMEGKMEFLEKTTIGKINGPTPLPLMSDQMELPFRVGGGQKGIRRIENGNAD